MRPSSFLHVLWRAGWNWIGYVRTPAGCSSSCSCDAARQVDVIHGMVDPSAHTANTRSRRRRSKQIHDYVISVHTLVLLVLVIASCFSAAPAKVEAADSPIYWGALIKGITYGMDDPPWSMSALDTFEANAGKQVSILHWGESWYSSAKGGYIPFETKLFERVRQRGSITMVSWSSWDQSLGDRPSSPTSS